MSEEKDKLEDLPKVKGSFKKPSITNDIGKYVLDEYIIPNTKDLVHDTFASILDIIGDSLQGALNKAIYKEDRPRKRKSGERRNYSGYSESISSSSSLKRDIGRRSSTQVAELWVDTEDKAEYVVNTMHKYIDRYGQAKVSDLYQVFDPPLPIIFTDYKFGWKSMDDIWYDKVRTGEHRGEFVILTSEPIPINN